MIRATFRSSIVFAASLWSAAALDLSKAVVVAPSGLSKPEQKAVTMLLEEIQKRTQIKLERSESWPSTATTVIAVGQSTSLKTVAGKSTKLPALRRAARNAEGYQIQITKSGGTTVVFVIGNDARGVLFGVGQLLRTLRLNPGAILLPNGFSVATSPKFPLRGHQLGYRPKTNSYDGWDVPTWEQYIRDLIIFGCNAIELIPPRSDDASNSPHFPLPPMEMMVQMSRLADEYGLDVWIWYPAMDRDYSNPNTVEFALNEWKQVFQKLPRIDAVFVPGGDPGHTQPKHLMGLLEKQTASLHRTHPKAQMWVSPQSFNQEWLEEFLGILRDEKPAWLSGVVYGPQVRTGLPNFRSMIPKQYPIRNYPDITHSWRCEYPAPDWDSAFPATEGREPINPRPLDEAAIFKYAKPYTIGFLTYSEGCNDDVNKCIWSALGWNPEANVTNVLREFSRYFIGDAYTEHFAQGVLALERNWRGALLTNENVFATLEHFQKLEKSAPAVVQQNWRLQQVLYRAYYDAYTRSRLIYENGLEEQAMKRLRDAGKSDQAAALSEAEAILDRAETNRVSGEWRARVFELAEALFKSIKMQLSVPLYKAIAVERGANLDNIDAPLNSRVWLKAQFAEIRELPNESERRARIETILDWTDPGPDGFYDDLGDIRRQPHLIRGPGFQKDPRSMESSMVDFGYKNGRLSWWNNAGTLFETPLQLRYTGLDRAAQYKLRINYASDSTTKKIRLTANDKFEIHPFMDKRFQGGPLEFDLPAAATQGGKLTLSWNRESGLGDNGRGCQVAEVWLIKK